MDWWCGKLVWCENLAYVSVYPKIIGLEMSHTIFDMNMENPQKKITERYSKG